MKLAVVACVHGNEKYGLEVVKRLSGSISFFIGNEKATRENKRFVDVDLNRAFPGNETGNYEERRAFELAARLKDFDFVIDLHSSSNDCKMFGIITKQNNVKIEFAKKLGLKKLVIMSEDFAKGNALIDFVKCGLSIEVGSHNRKENVDEAVEVIENFLLEKNRNEDIEIFKVKSKLMKKYDKVLIKNFEKVKEGMILTIGNFGEKQLAEEDFVAVLVDEEAYGDVLCLCCERLRLKIKMREH